MASNAINMFYKQIILHRGLPFEVKIPASQPINFYNLSETERNNELEKGYEDMQSNQTGDAESVFSDIRKDYGV